MIKWMILLSDFACVSKLSTNCFWWISNTKPRKLFNLFRYCSCTSEIAKKLRQLFNAWLALGSWCWSTLRFFLLLAPVSSVHSALFVCLIIIIMLHTMHVSTIFSFPLFFFSSFSYETINDCRFYYIAFRVSLTITLRWSSRNVASFSARQIYFAVELNTLRSFILSGEND